MNKIKYKRMISKNSKTIKKDQEGLIKKYKIKESFKNNQAQEANFQPPKKEFTITVLILTIVLISQTINLNL
jgi:hypothetical protein